MPLVLPLVLPAAGARASAQPADARPIDVVEVNGPFDERLVDFVIGQIDALASGAEVVILQIDSPGSVTGEIGRLIEYVRSPPVPLAVWIGPRPAVAYGGALQVLEAAPFRLAADGVEIGYYHPKVAGDSIAADAAAPAGLVDQTIEVDRPIPGLVDEMAPILGAVVVALDGREFVVDGEVRTITTTEAYVDEQGETRTRPAGTIRLHEPDMLSRTLRLATRPEVAFLFLAVGISVAAFEFYAAGVGIAAAVAVVLLGLAGYGLAVLPMRWWAVGLVPVGLALYVFDFQRATVRIGAAAGSIALLAGGKLMVAGSPQISTGWTGVVLTVLAVGAFFLFGMTTVVRARFSTPTIGRDHLIGKHGIAETDLSPEGIVAVEGARWQASAARAAELRPGDRVVVVAVDGILLKVEPLPRPGHQP